MFYLCFKIKPFLHSFHILLTNCFASKTFVCHFIGIRRATGIVVPFGASVLLTFKRFANLVKS